MGMPLLNCLVNSIILVVVGILAVSTGQIPNGYHNTPGIGAHKLHSTPATWNNARKACLVEGGHLAIINSYAEAELLANKLDQLSATHAAFLGIHDLFLEGDWVTVEGDSLATTGYTTWSSKWGGQPDNWAGKQHCGVILYDGGMDDERCDRYFPFFCEIN